MIPVVLRQSRRLCRAISFAAIVLACTTIAGTPGLARGAEDAPHWNDLPVAASVQVAPLNLVQRDLAFLWDGTDRAATRAAGDMLDELAKVIDGTRPAGMAALVDEIFVPIIYVPIKKDAEPLLRFLRERFGWRFHRGDDGLLRGDDLRMVARASASWIYFHGTGSS